ncbi:MAG: hypothetical protein CO021_09360 [Deltaproteobacteria bacterium CG_4_9_14_0_2_um_filter_42_21]|nr:MAG: hypothetical protein CO021_09360 [Deltaproteobacteria bacterium CG_4_9_14_0_2_um_filter_42_21]
MTIAPRIFGLPAMPVRQFISRALISPDTATQFVRDTNPSLSPLTPAHRANLFSTSPLDESALESRYKAVAEAKRRAAVANELELTRPHILRLDLQEWMQAAEARGAVTAAEKQDYILGISALVKAAPLIDDIYKDQIGVNDSIKAAIATEALTDDDRELLKRQRHPWGESDPKNPFAVALPSLPARRSGVVPNGISKAEFGSDISGNAHPFSVLQRDGDGFTSVHYHEHYGDKLGRVNTN